MLVKIVNRLLSYLKIDVRESYFKAVDTNSPNIAAIFLSLLTKKVNKGKSGNKKILCLGRSIFINDINALAQYGGRFQYLIFNKGMIGYIIRKFIPHPDLSEQTYHIDERFVVGRKQAYYFTKTLFKWYYLLQRFDAVMTCNFGYVDQQEFIKIARENNIPVIVLYKEGLINKANIDELMLSYKTRKSQCDLFLCYNNYIKSAILRHKLEGLSKNKIKVTGVPRLDQYVIDRKDNVSNQVVLFSFYPDDKFRYIVKDEQILEKLRHQSKAFHQKVMRYAEENQDTKVIIKTKVAEHYLQYVKDISLDYFGSYGLPENLTITRDADSASLILSSRVVMGSNSTVLLEALLAGKLIACPDFNKVLNIVGWDLLEGYEQLVDYITDYQQMVEVINSRNTKRTNCLDELIEHYIFCADGQSSKRVENHILSLFD